jgi:SAM-dependent methyltransferase
MGARFQFGKNWQSFLSTVSGGSVAHAEQGLRRLFATLPSGSFLDIGCGSGLSLLAAHRLGANELTGIDFDPDSVAAARTLLADSGARIEERSVFDLDPDDGMFDVVYSWGVLHHTGDLWRALDNAAAMVKPGGLLAIAIYRKTAFCGLWKIEKFAYTKAPAPVQKLMRAIYKLAFLAGLCATGRNPFAYIRDYKSDRGMSWHHDVHDWLGGYPYQSASPYELENFFGRKSFAVISVNQHKARLGGLFGSHCDEYVARRLHRGTYQSTVLARREKGKDPLGKQGY